MSARSVRTAALALAAGLALGCASRPGAVANRVREVHLAGVERDEAAIAHWGPDRRRYVSWDDHTNRLLPVYTFGTRGGGAGVDLDGYTGPASPYRDEALVRELYGEVPASSVAAAAEYMDQTQIAAIQRAALGAGRRHVILFVFDGLDFETARAAAVVRAGAVRYAEGRGTGLHFQDYAADGTAQFSFMVTSPLRDRANVDVDAQTVVPEEGSRGGYDPVLGGATPWSPGSDPLYVTGTGRIRHAVTDSAASATSLCSGIKTYNGAINVDPAGRQVDTVAHEAQRLGLSVGVVTSVPLSHATPAAAYAHNVSRGDYQDLSRDLLGLPSVSHPDPPLAGMDVVIGCGHGIAARSDRGQGSNFVPGNRYVAERDLERVDVRNGGRYVVARREAGREGAGRLAAAAAEAAATGRRLLGLYGVAGAHLPYRTATGDYRPVRAPGGPAEEYSGADLEENPTLAQMTAAALSVLETNERGFWLMVEAGDVDWANHDANLDSAIGAVLDGDDAVRVVTEWVDSHGGWDEALVIVTSDHGHYLVLEEPAALLGQAR